MGTTLTKSQDKEEGKDEEELIYRAVIESCSGWRLNKLPEVKNFIFADFEPLYERSVFIKIAGKSPEIIFFTESGKEVERINIEKFTRDELNELMVARGIPKKSDQGHDEA